MVENGEWSVAHKKYDFQAIRVRISELIPTGAKPRMYRVGRNTLIKALKNRIIQASEGRSVTLLDSRTKKEVSELDSIADLVPIDSLTENTSKLGPVVELKLDWGIPSEPSAACRPVRAARVFHRNVSECISAAKSGTHPAKRPRHSAEEGPSEKRPRVEHFVQDTKSLQRTFSQLSDMMGQLSELVEANKPGTMRETGVVFRNSMDAFRFMIPMLQHITSLALPVKFDSSSEILALAPDMSIPSQPLTQTPSPSTQGSVKSEPSADDSD